MPLIRRGEFIVLLVVAIASVLVAWALVSWVPTGLTGRYWSNSAFEGTPVAESRGAVPDLGDFMSHLPHRANQGSAEWTGFLIVDTPGRHTFELISDDGAWLFLDDAMVIDNGGTHPRQSVGKDVELSAGPHRVRIRHFEAGGSQAFVLLWTMAGGRRVPIARTDLAPDERSAMRQPPASVRQVLPVAVPVLWGCVFFYLPARVIGSWMWRQVARVSTDTRGRRLLLVLLCAAAGLLSWGIEWSLLYVDKWAPDELTPGWVRDGLDARFSGGWYDKYPVLHYAVLAIPVSAFSLASDLGILDAGSLVSYTAQLALMRSVSVVMALGALVAAFVCGAELWGGRRAILAPIALLLTPQFLFYGKLANLDVPMLCWFGWAVYAFIRIWRANRQSDYVLLGISAAGAVATKDQAYASLALLPLAVLVATARHQASAAWWRRLASAVVDAKVWFGALAAVLASVVLHNMVFNFEGFVRHFEVLTSFGDELAVVPRTAAGYMDLTGTTVMLLRFVAGWPMFILAIAGIARAAVHQDRRWWLWLLVVPLSFHLTFTWVTLYVNDRYLFGGTFVLALFAGSACADLLESRRWRPAARAAVAAALLYSLLYAASINVMMQRDARDAARDWVTARATGDTVVGMVGGYLPNFPDPLRTVSIDAPADLHARMPDFIIVNARFAQRFAAARRPDGRDLLRGLQNGSLGYTEVFRWRGPAPAWAILWSEAPIAGPAESPWTNLDKVNPEMVIYRRNGP